MIPTYSTSSTPTSSLSRASDIEAEVYEAVRGSGLLADLEDEDDLPEPDDDEDDDEDDDDENEEDNEDDYDEVRALVVSSPRINLCSIEKISVCFNFRSCENVRAVVSGKDFIRSVKADCVSYSILLKRFLVIFHVSL